MLIIDVQEDFFQSGRMADKRSSFTSSINDLIGAFRSSELPIIWVRQVFKDDLSDSYMSLRKSGKKWTIEGTPGCELLRELDFHPSDVEIIKKRYSAFFNTNLEERLKVINPDKIVIAGVNTHACVRVTAIDAYQRDYNLILAKECIDSYTESGHEESFKYMCSSGIGIPMKNNEIVMCVND